MASTLEKELDFEYKTKEGKKYLISLSRSDIISEFRWHDYCLSIGNKEEMGELIFGKFGAIVDCRYYNHKEGIYGNISVRKFKEKFQDIIKEVFSEEIYEKYLIAMDMGVEGIKKGADIDNKNLLYNLFGITDLKFGFLDK